MAGQTKQQIGIWETIYNDTVEQSVELDYMLPDYYPSIFKILKGSMVPVLQSHRVVGNKLTIEGTAYLKILYLNQVDGGMRLLEQSQPFVKTVDLKQDATGGKARLSARCSYFHARAVSGQRLDLRGAISIKACVTRPSEVELLRSDDQLQLSCKEVSLCDRQNTVEKEISVSEQIQIGQGNPTLREVLHTTAVAVVEQATAMDGKLVCKGKVTLHTMYLPVGEDSKPAHIEQSIGFSQIVEFMELQETDPLHCVAKVLRCNLELQLEEDEECHSFMATVELKLCCSMASNQPVVLVQDGYSIGYETEMTTQTMPTKRLLCAVNETPMIKETVALRGEISAVYHLMGEVQNSSFECRDGALWLCGNLGLSVLALDLEGACCCLEQTVAFEFPLMSLQQQNQIAFDWDEQILSIDYQILSAGELAVQIQLAVGGLLYQCETIEAVSGLTVKDDCPKQKSERTALRLYFADQDESVWAIAKRYNTAMRAIVSENQLQGEQVTSRQMLLIPLVD